MQKDHHRNHPVVPAQIGQIQTGVRQAMQREALGLGLGLFLEYEQQGGTPPIRCPEFVRCPEPRRLERVVVYPSREASMLEELPELLRGEGICVRPFVPADAEGFACAARESARSVGRWMSWCHADFSVGEARAWFAICAAELAAGSAFELGIFAGDGGEVLGGIGLNHVIVEHKFCNLGYWVRASRQREGIATRAVRTMARFGFADLGLMRIEIVVAEGNVPSAGVARKAGALYEGLARNRLVVGGASVAAWMFSMVPDSVGPAQ
jgi:RimJ/RimL family protein N-acetyltransferase